MRLLLLLLAALVQCRETIAAGVALQQCAAVRRINVY